MRETLPAVAKTDLNWDIDSALAKASDKPIIDVFQRTIGKDFSKYKLAKAFLKWSRDHSLSDLAPHEIEGCTNLITAINAALK